jgi:accessory gene regulator protein AgrB
MNYEFSEMLRVFLRVQHQKDLEEAVASDREHKDVPHSETREQEKKVIIIISTLLLLMSDVIKICIHDGNISPLYTIHISISRIGAERIMSEIRARGNQDTSMFA